MKYFLEGAKPKGISRPDWQLVRAVSSRYGINPYLVAAIGVVQTAWGRRGPRAKYDVFGLNSPKGTEKASKTESLYEQLNVLSTSIAADLIHPVTESSLAAYAVKASLPTGDPSAWAVSVLDAYENALEGTGAHYDPLYSVSPVDAHNLPRSATQTVFHSLTITLGDWGILNPIRDLVQSYVVNPIVSVLNNLYDAIGLSGGILGTVWDVIRTYVPQMYIVFVEWWTNIKTFFGVEWDRWYIAHLTLGYKIWRLHVDVGSAIHDYLNFALSYLWSLYEGGAEFASWLYKEVAEFLVWLYEDASDVLIDFVDRLYDQLVYFTDELLPRVVDFFTNLYDFFREIYEKYRDNLLLLLSDPLAFFSALFERLVNMSIGFIFNALVWFVEKVW